MLMQQPMSTSSDVRANIEGTCNLKVPLFDAGSWQRPKDM